MEKVEAQQAQPSQRISTNLGILGQLIGDLVDQTRELDRRNFRAALRARCPVTRNFLAESESSCETAQYTADFLRHYLRRCEPNVLEDIKLFARHGGPDLSDLRNVCTAIYMPAGANADDTL